MYDKKGYISMTILMGRGCIDVEGASGGSKPHGLRGLLGVACWPSLLAGD